MASQQRGVILDGNVKRVLARFAAVTGEPNNADTQQKLWALAETLTPHERVGAYTQAMMDLGATLCTRSKPLCLYCPLQSQCQAFALGTPTAFPEKKKSKSIPTKKAYFLILENQQGEVLWVKRPPTGIWGSLWCLPEIVADSEDELRQILRQNYGIGVTNIEYLASFSHTFSHYHLQLQPIWIKANPRLLADSNSQWCSLTQAENLGLPTAMTKLLKMLQR